MTTEMKEIGRHVRFLPRQDAALRRLADEEGTTVSALIRRAVIQTFCLPTGATNGGDAPQTDNGVTGNYDDTPGAALEQAEASS